MNTTTSTTGVTFVQAAQLLAAHLADHVLPEPASLAVATRDGRSEVHAQLNSLTVPMVAVELLAWANTLTTITVGAWRPPAGDRVHLSIASTLTGPVGTVSLDVYGGADHDPALIADLEPGQRVAYPWGNCVPGRTAPRTPVEVQNDHQHRGCDRTAEPAHQGRADAPTLGRRCCSGGR